VYRAYGTRAFTSVRHTGPCISASTDRQTRIIETACSAEAIVSKSIDNDDDDDDEIVSLLQPSTVRWDRGASGANATFDAVRALDSALVR